MGGRLRSWAAVVGLSTVALAGCGGGGHSATPEERIARYHANAELLGVEPAIKVFDNVEDAYCVTSDKLTGAARGLQVATIEEGDSFEARMASLNVKMTGGSERVYVLHKLAAMDAWCPDKIDDFMAYDSTIDVLHLADGEDGATPADVPGAIEARRLLDRD